MVDWVVLLTPLALFPVFWLLGFVGCSIETTGAAPASPGAVETETKPVSLTWSGALGDTTSIAFSCDVWELDKAGAKTGEPFHGVALTQMAWPGSFVPSSGKVSALVTVEMPPAAQYQAKGTCEVTWGSSSNTPPQKLVWEKPVGNWDSSWDFFLTHGAPQGWTLT